MSIALNDYGAWCVTAGITAFGVMLTAMFVVRMMGSIGGAAIGLPDEDSDD